MSKITEALSKLDPNNDNHWTSDGLPRIDTVKMLAGNPALTREMITAEVPSFSRQIALASVTQVPDSANAQAAPAVDTVQEQGTAETAETVVKDYAQLIAQAQEELQAAITAREEAQVLVSEKQNALDDLINEREAVGAGERPMDAISGYLQSQQGVLQERARRHAVLVESGVTLNDIQNLIPQRAPLDVALSSKKK